MAISTSREAVIALVAEHAAGELELKILDEDLDDSGLTEHQLTKATLISPADDELVMLQEKMNQRLRSGAHVIGLEVVYPMRLRARFVILN